MWEFLSDVASASSDPLLIGGDFNAILSAEDRLHGSPFTESDIKDFSDCLQMNDLTPVRMVGNAFTWCNNQSGEDRIYSLIDRCVANASWFAEYSSIVVEVMERMVSDHCPLLLHFYAVNVVRNTPFKFLNALTDHTDFQTILSNCWHLNLHKNKILNIWYRLK